jgi:hypothetical protein
LFVMADFTIRKTEVFTTSFAFIAAVRSFTIFCFKFINLSVVRCPLSVAV